MAKTVPLRRNTAFQLLWVGGAADGLGTEVTKLATPLLVLAATGSPAWAGVVARASLAGSMAVAVPAGVWIDRWDRRRVLVAGQAVLGGALAAGLGAAPALVVVGAVLVLTAVLPRRAAICAGSPTRTPRNRRPKPSRRMRLRSVTTHPPSPNGPPTSARFPTTECNLLDRSVEDPA